MPAMMLWSYPLITTAEGAEIFDFLGGALMVCNTLLLCNLTCTICALLIMQ